MKKSQKKRPQYRARKNAFDKVIQAYRDAKEVKVGFSAVNMVNDAKGAVNPSHQIRPTLVDFRADVELVFRKIFKAASAWKTFQEAYLLFDSEDPIEMGVLAQKLLGRDAMNNLEQGVGAEFIKRGIFPMHGKNSYFRTRRAA
jgi:hypothetical protein